MLCVLAHFILQGSALLVIVLVIQRKLIVYPSNVYLYIGVYGGVASLVLDLLFLAFFNYSDQFTFFHAPFPDVDVDVIKPRDKLAL
jgi:hypothetical protein